MRHINNLADDSLEGRAPGTPGEMKTVAYLESEFKALGITESYIDEVRKAGYGRIEPSKLVQMKALGITADDLVATGDERR